MKHNEISIVLGFGASALKTNIDQTSIKKRSQDRSAFWHRFLTDFWSILGAFWDQSRPKNDPKNHQKNDLEKRMSYIPLANPIGPPTPT